MKRILLLLLCLLSGMEALPQDPVPVPIKTQIGTKWGYDDQNGNRVIGPKFEKAFTFIDGIAQVKNSNGYLGYIDTEGNMIYDFIFKEASAFGRDFLGERIPSNCAYATIYMHNAMNSKGQYAFGIYPPELSEDILKESYQLRYGVITRNGQVVVPFNYSTDNENKPEIVGDRMILRYKQDDKQISALLNDRGGAIIKPFPGELYWLTSDRVMGLQMHNVRQNGRITRLKLAQLYDKYGNVLVPYEKGYIEFSIIPGREPTKVFTPTQAMDYALNNMGKQYVKPEHMYFKDAGNFLFRATRSIGGENKAGLINGDGKEIIQTLYKDIMFFYKLDGSSISRSYGVVCMSGDYCDEKFYINSKGECTQGCPEFVDFDYEGYITLELISEVKEQSLELPWRKAGSTVEGSPFYVLKGLDFIEKAEKEIEYDEKGLAVKGTRFDDQFKYILAWEDRMLMFNDEGKASPLYFTSGMTPESLLYEFYNFYKEYQTSFSVGQHIQFQKEDESWSYSMVDWHQNYIIQPDKKYKLNWYMQNNLLWLKEIADESKDYVLDANEMELIPVPVEDKIRAIYQTRDNAVLFPLTREGDLYRLPLNNGSELKKIGNGINWLMVCQYEQKIYLLVYNQQTKKYGLINSSGEILLEMEYDDIQASTDLIEPIVFTSKNNALGVFDLLKKEQKTIHTKIEFNSKSFRKAFGKYASCLAEDDHLLILDKYGNEVVKIKAEKFYGQPDEYSMAYRKGRWFFVDEKGNNPFGEDFIDIYPFQNDRALVILDNERNAYINRKGEIIIGPYFIHK